MNALEVNPEQSAFTILARSLADGIGCAYCVPRLGVRRIWMPALEIRLPINRNKSCKNTITLLLAQAPQVAS